MHRPVFCALLCLLVLYTAGCGDEPGALEQLHTRTVVLPGGQEILAEVVSDPADMARGLMFRDSLAPDRGMLFIHNAAGRHPYWMFQVRIPLDIIWLGPDRAIVEISAATPPCRTESSGCPQYGGNQDAQFVLELAGGMAGKYGLKLGDRISF